MKGEEYNDLIIEPWQKISLQNLYPEVWSTMLDKGVESLKLKVKSKDATAIW